MADGDTGRVLKTCWRDRRSSACATSGRSERRWAISDVKCCRRCTKSSLWISLIDCTAALRGLSIDIPNPWVPHPLSRCGTIKSARSRLATYKVVRDRCHAAAHTREGSPIVGE